ncbi:MAG: hypothetical protein QGF59_24595, partial [Pirellulaceae bacterium]|nr:hypothetical protein [Pirellulaceae bacterium]
HVHVFEDYETEIEKRWWLRGKPVTDGTPDSLSKSVANTRFCRSSDTHDFDRKMGDQSKRYNAVIFNPVPGPPMGSNTRLSFRYRLTGTDVLRVQIYSLSKNYHRHLVLTGLEQEVWKSATVDMTKARRPDGSGGALSKDERIDDIQFYVNREASAEIDDIILYDEESSNEHRPFPRRIIWTGWFDTGKQGKEWPGDFEIVLHKPPRSWDAARGVVHPQTGKTWLRIQMRGMRTMSEKTQLALKYHLTDSGSLQIRLVNSVSGKSTDKTVVDLLSGAWMSATVEFGFADVTGKDRLADEIWIVSDAGSGLLVDDLLLYEPGE